MSTAALVWSLSRLALADRGGVVTVLRVFMDETGTDEGSAVVAAGAYIGTAKEWRRWTKEWNKAKYPIQVYHAADAQNLHGEFKGWTRDNVAALAAKLLPIIADAQLAGFVNAIRIKELVAATIEKPHLLQLVKTSKYEICFYYLIRQILKLASEAGNKDRIAFIHEENNLRGPLMAAFDHVKKYDNPGNNIVSLTFAGKNDYAPLQAADILAYEANKRLRKVSAPIRRAWTALGAERYISSNATTNIQEVVAELELLLEINGTLTPWR